MLNINLMRELKIIQNSLINRFFKKVEKTSTCWLWKAARHGANKYGVFWDGKRNKAAHRFSFEIHKGNIDQGKVVMHICDNPICVNPEHLTLGTQKENLYDAIKKGRLIPGLRGERDINGKIQRKTVCLRGHDVSTPESVYINPNNPNKGKICRKCRTLMNSALYKKRIERNNQHG